MSLDVNCWDCNFFQPKNVGVDNSGWCRKNPPRGIDMKSQTEPIDPLDVFPPIEDALIENCGDYQQSSGEIPLAIITEE